MLRGAPGAGSRFGPGPVPAAALLMSFSSSAAWELANAPIPLPARLARRLAFPEGLGVSFAPLVNFLSFPGTLMPAALRDVQSKAGGT